MDKNWYMRFATLVTAIVLAVLALWPSLGRWVEAPQWVKSAFSGRISPGLDIRGGLRLMYEVEVDEYIRDRRDRSAEQVLRQCGVLGGIVDEDQSDIGSREVRDQVQERCRIERVDRGADHSIRLTFTDAKDGKKLTKAWVKDNFRDIRVKSGAGTPVVELSLRSEQLESLRKTAVYQAVRTISDRIDKLGLREATVIGRDDDIIVEVPGADESSFEYIKSIISRTARLEFKILDDESDFVQALADLPAGIEKTSEVSSAGVSRPSVTTSYLVSSGEGSREILQNYVDSLDVPDDHQLALGRDSDSSGAAEAGEESWRTYYLYNVADVTGEDLDDAAVGFDAQEGNRPQVDLTFNRRGAERFADLTRANIKRRMAIVLDDRVESAPVIQGEIGGGRGRITMGSFGNRDQIFKDAQDLVVVLQAGALPAPLRPANEQLIGPTLGEDSVQKGALGAVVGICFVLVLMLFIYHVAGIVSDLMVLLNLLFLLAIMAALEATLTLPGVAAVALTVGMAVDANVLVIERIREELHAGRSARSAVERGFSRAFSSVFDSQITTAIAGVVLLQFGSGPIKGFASMLLIGIATSLFTGIFVSKICFDWIVRGLRVERLRVG